MTTDLIDVDTREVPDVTGRCSGRPERSGSDTSGYGASALMGLREEDSGTLQCLYLIPRCFKGSIPLVLIDVHG